MDERTNGRMQICAAGKIEAVRKTQGKGRKGEDVPGLKRMRENEQKHIREYGRADELPPGRFHRSRCYPRRMTVRAGGRAIRGKGRGKGRWFVATWVEDMAEERTTDVAHYANVSRYVVQRKQTEPEAPTPYTHHASRRHPLTSSLVA